MSASIDCARRFIGQVMEAEPPPSTTQLITLLDELARAYNNCPEGDVTDEEFKVPSHGSATHALVRERFPEFGYYAIADPLATVDNDPLTADAADDLSDIINDLYEAIETYEKLGAVDAHWIFRFTYQIHWGAHLRHLAVYLHFKEFYR